MHKVHSYAFLAAILLAASPVFADVNLVEDFSTDPLLTNRWHFGIGSNGNSQFLYQNSPSAFGGDGTGSLAVHLNSSLPTARLDLGLGESLTDTNNFTITAQFALTVTGSTPFETMQMSFGLVNSTLTGGDRTGSFANFGSDNTFHTVEFNYFPNVTSFGNFDGPSLTPSVFGAQKPGNDAFGNFTSLYEEQSDLGSNTGGGVTALPLSTYLQATLSYTGGSTKQLTLEIAQINPATGALTTLVTELPPLNLLTTPRFGAGYDPNFGFNVNTLAIMAYKDGFTTSEDPSIVADVTFQKFTVTSSVPEPTASALLLGIGLLGAARRRPHPASTGVM